MIRDIPLTSDPLLLADWREAAGLVLDRLLAAGLAAPSALRVPAAERAAPSAALLAAIADGAASAAARYCDYDALLGREAALDAKWPRWKYGGDGTSSVYAEDASPADSRDLSVLKTSFDPLPAAPPPGTPLRAESVRLCLATVVRAMRRCRYAWAPPSAFTPARGTVWSSREDGAAADRIHRSGPGSKGFLTASAWLSAIANGGTQTLCEGSMPGQWTNPHETVRPHYPVYHVAWRVLGDEAAGGASAYPSVRISVWRSWAAVQTLTYRDPNGQDPTSYSYGPVFPCALGGDVAVSVSGAGMLPRNPRAQGVLWHLWPGGFDSVDPGWSADDAPLLVESAGLYDNAHGFTWDTPDGYSRDATLYHLSRGPWVRTDPAEPLVPALLDFPSSRPWLAQPDDLHGGDFCQDSPVAKNHIVTGNGSDNYGYKADLALLDLGEPPSKETLT